jgi:hypothetical protein
MMFAWWMLAGCLLTASLLALTSFGLYLLPFAITAILFAVRRTTVWPGIIGVADGSALPILWVALLNRRVPRCSADGFTALTTRGCTSVDPNQWLTWALFLGGAGLAGYLWARSFNIRCSGRPSGRPSSGRV